MGGLIGAGVGAAASAAAGAGGAIASSLASTLVPIISGVAQGVGAIVKGVSGGGVQKSQQVPYPLTQDQSNTSQMLAHSLGQNFGAPQIGSFGGLPGMGGGNSMLGRIQQLQGKLGTLTSNPPPVRFG